MKRNIKRDTSTMHGKEHLIRSFDSSVTSGSSEVIQHTEGKSDMFMTFQSVTLPYSQTNNIEHIYVLIRLGTGMF
jgi:hypothetical protein